MTRKILALVSSAALLLLTARPAISAPDELKQTAASEDDATAKALVAIAGAGDMESHAYQDLEELSDDIGARVTGSPHPARAIARGGGEKKKSGPQKIH